MSATILAHSALEQLSQLVADTLGVSGFGRTAVYAGIIFVVAMAVCFVVLTIAGILTWAERRVAGRTQSRVGPNRVGPLGFLQWLVDGVKLVMKEDVVPDAADKPMFKLAPYLSVVGVFSAFAAIPFGQYLIAADLNVAALYLVAITSLVVVGILMAGWSSNNKWALLGGVRSAAQIASYEIPSALSLLSIVLLAGTLSLQGIIAKQGGWPYEWFIFHNPFAFVAFFLFFTSAIAEGNRTPFDLPEAESELVAGYNVEYSGMRFAGFFLGEFANIYLISAIATALFFGGWRIPGVTLAEQGASLGLELAGVLVFAAKASFGAFFVLWLRWTLPRLRVDQLMGLCYRFLLPLAFAALLGNALYVWLVPAGSAIDLAVHGVMTAVGVLVVGVFAWRVAHHVIHTKDRVSFDLARGERGRFDAAVQVRAYGALKRQAVKEAR